MPAPDATNAPDDATAPSVTELLEDHGLLLAALETPAFWNRELRRRGDDPHVVGVRTRAVGTGQVASCHRVVFDLDGGDSGGFPSSVVVKTGSEDPTSRLTSATLRHPETEVGFYSRMAPTCTARVPRCHLAALNANGDDFLLVLEDLTGATQGDQVGGMEPEHVGAALDELADLHATWWAGPPGGTEEFLTDRGDPNAHAVLLAMLYEGFAERYASVLDAEVLSAAERLVGLASRYLVERPGPTSVTHGDFRPDNLLLPDADGSDRVAVVDWQTVSVGPALADVSYFMGGAMPPELRRRHEAELLGRYGSRLRSRGIGVTDDEITSGYRRYALDGLVMAIGASQVVGRTERGDEMFCAMATRSAHHALEAGSFELI